MADEVDGAASTIGSKGKLSGRELDFVKRYTDRESTTYHNATRSYIAAGYSEKGANGSAAKLMQRERIRAAVDRYEQRELATQTRETWELEDAISEFERLRDRAEAKGDLSTARACIESICRVRGFWKDGANAQESDVKRLEASEAEEAERIAALLVGQTQPVESMRFAPSLEPASDVP